MSASTAAQSLHAGLCRTYGTPGGGLIIQHLTAQALSVTPAALELIDAARASGFAVIGEIYPYDYGGTIVGADADLTLFDQESVSDNSTMRQGGLPSSGIPYVVVNGTIVVKDSRVLENVYPGQAIRVK